MQPISLNRSIVDGSPLDPPEPPHVQPPFYGGLVVNTFVGRTGTSALVELDIGDADVSGYAAFEEGVLVRAVFVNLHAWLASSTGDRPSVHIDLDFARGNANVTQQDADAFWGRAATGTRLVIQHADDTQNLTWAGQSYEETPLVAASGPLVTESVDLTQGVDLNATEALLIEFY